MIGRILGSYQITALIREGGMGVVYAGKHLTIGRPVAIKILHKRFTDDADFVRRFLQEAPAAAKIRHPGVVQMFDCGQAEDRTAFLVMELLEGEDLMARLRRRGYLPDEEVIRLSRQVANALAAAHQSGIIHRDLKPENIFITPDNSVIGGERIKVLDFGIAKWFGDAATELRSTRTGMVLGTPMYMSPEQCVGAPDITPLVDIYSLGCVMYHMACGQTPFSGGGAGAIIGKQIYEQPPPPSTRVPGLSVELEAIILTCMAKRPVERFASMDALIAALDRVHNGRYAAPSLVGILPGQPDRSAPPLVPSNTLAQAASQVAMSPLRRRRLGRVFALALVASAVISVILLMHEPGTQERAVSQEAAVSDEAGVSDEAAAGSSDAEDQDAGAPAAAGQVVDAGTGRGQDALAGSGVPDAASAAAGVVDAAPAAINNVQVVIKVKPKGAFVRTTEGEFLGKAPFQTQVPRSDMPMVFAIAYPGYENSTVMVVPDRDRTAEVVLERDEPKRKRTTRRSGGNVPTKSKDSWGKTANPFED